ncbi:TetR/AcrR family transcriptional regulator [uncultured Devosia sp.]|uniref:TetR/AcrR family transcriptional regulator n=1 Tax=uncultured Devosia sp. TaxID=211434 RepID=UPI0035CADD08
MSETQVDKSPRGPRAARKQARPREILEAAFEEFLQKGYAATRLDDIAARVGVTKGTLYVYFANKEQLFEAMVGELSQPVIESLHYERALDDASAFEVISLFLTDLYAVITDHYYTKEIIRFLIAEGNTFRDLLERHHRNFVQPTFSIVSLIIERGCERGEFRQSARDYAPSFLLSPLIGTTIMRMVALEDISDHASYYQNHLSMLRALLIQTENDPA